MMWRAVGSLATRHLLQLLRVRFLTAVTPCAVWFSTLRWRQNERDGVSNNRPNDCLLNRLFRHRSKKTSKLRFTGLCEGNSPETGEFPAQRASNAENVSIWWRRDSRHSDSPPPPPPRLIYTLKRIYIYMYIYICRVSDDNTRTYILSHWLWGKNRHSAADDIFECILLNEN